MVFGKTTSAMQSARTQDDLVAERIEAKPDLLEEDVEFPGLQMVHLMTEGELIDFFTMVLKSRLHIRQVELTLGENYKTTEKQVTVPKSDRLHSMEFGEAARVLVMALGAGGDNCIGFRASIAADREGNISSKLYVKVADKKAHGPTFDEAGNEDIPGDPEFDPRLVITSKP
jgi:hypothetical protein